MNLNSKLPGYLNLGYELNSASLNVNKESIFVTGLLTKSSQTTEFVAIKIDKQGKIDNQYGVGGVASIQFGADVHILSSEVSSDGKLVFSVKEFDWKSNQYKYSLVRLGTAGILDKSFSQDGVYEFNQFIDEVEIDTKNDEILVFGQKIFVLSDRGSLLRTLPVSDTTFTSDFLFDLVERDVHGNVFGMKENGYFLVYDKNGVMYPSIDEHISPSSFGETLVISDIAIDPDGALIATGRRFKKSQSSLQKIYEYPTTVKFVELDKLNTKSVAYSLIEWERSDNLPGGIYDGSDTLVALADGSLVVVGSSIYNEPSGQKYGVSVKKFSSDGAINSSFAGGDGFFRVATGYVFAKGSNYKKADMELLDNDSIIILGHSQSSADKTLGIVLFSVNLDGELDQNFGTTALDQGDGSDGSDDADSLDYLSLGLQKNLSDGFYVKFGFNVNVADLKLIRNRDDSWTSIIKGKPTAIWVGYREVELKDYSVRLDINGVAGQAYRIYKAAFDRNPDAGGLGYWIAQMDKGMGVVEVAARFIDSPEFRSLYGQDPSNAEFLSKVYSNVLDRNPDQSGLVWWVNEMKTNPTKTWQKVLADFSESTENQANVASLIANGVTYDPWGL